MVRSYPMNPKVKITKYVAEELGLVTDDKALRQLKRLWWRNPRVKAKGGLELTEQGAVCLQQAGLKCYRVRFEEPITYSNQMIIWLDNLIECPWFATKKEICVFDEKMAVQLVLFSGNIGRLVAIKAKNLKSA